MSDDQDRGRTGGEVAGDGLTDDGPSRPPAPSAPHRRRIREWYPGSAAERLRRRLEAIDVVNQGMLFAAVLLLSLVPLLIIVQALVGRSAATDLIQRFGLDDEASDAVGQVLTSPSSTSSAITGLSWVFLVLSGLAAATAIQELYERAFGVQGRGVKDTPRRLVWLAAFLGAVALAGLSIPWLRDLGGPVLIGVVVLASATGFWWFTMWLLLGGRLAWRDLFPSALATGVCWLGMDIAFRLTMSKTITTDYEKYGAIGVVFALMSFLIAVGVVIILGAVFGVVWRERRTGKGQ